MFSTHAAALGLAAAFFAGQSATAPDAAPGLPLPNNATVVLLDDAGSAAHLVPLHAKELHLNPHAAGNFGRSMVYAGPHRSMEVEGTTAEASITSHHPTIFVHLSNEDADLMRSRVTLLQLHPNKTTRTVMEFSNNVFGGSHKRYLDDVKVTKTDFAGGTWLKVTPDVELEPGQYGISFVPKDSSLFEDRVYDFVIASEPASRPKS